MGAPEALGLPTGGTPGVPGGAVDPGGSGCPSGPRAGAPGGGIPLFFMMGGIQKMQVVSWRSSSVMTTFAIKGRSWPFQFFSHFPVAPLG